MKSGSKIFKGNERFTVDSKDFRISPLSIDCNLHIVDNVDGVEKDKIIGELKANEHTKVHGGIIGDTYYIDTIDNTEKFKITYNYE